MAVLLLLLLLLKRTAQSQHVVAGSPPLDLTFRLVEVYLQCCVDCCCHIVLHVILLAVDDVNRVAATWDSEHL
jgi:hypothetical protein